MYIIISANAEPLLTLVFKHVLGSLKTKDFFEPSGRTWRLKVFNTGFPGNPPVLSVHYSNMGIQNSINLSAVSVMVSMYLDIA